MHRYFAAKGFVGTGFGTGFVAAVAKGFVAFRSASWGLFEDMYYSLVAKGFVAVVDTDFDKVVAKDFVAFRWAPWG